MIVRRSINESRYNRLNEGFNIGKFKPFSNKDYFSFRGMQQGFTDSGEPFDPLKYKSSNISIYVGFTAEDRSQIMVYWSIVEGGIDGELTDAGLSKWVRSDKDIEKAIEIGKKLISKANSVKTLDDFERVSKSLGLELFMY